MGSSLDLLATFASIADVETPVNRKMDSNDLSPILFGDASKEIRSDFFYWSNRAALSAISVGKWKLHVKQNAEVQIYLPAKELGQPELYNLNADPSEKHNVAEFYPEIVAELLQQLEIHRKDIDDALPDQLAGRIEFSN